MKTQAVLQMPLPPKQLDLSLARLHANQRYKLFCDYQEAQKQLDVLEQRRNDKIRSDRTMWRPRTIFAALDEFEKETNNLLLTWQMGSELLFTLMVARVCQSNENLKAVLQEEVPKAGKKEEKLDRCEHIERHKRLKVERRLSCESCLEEFDTYLAVSCSGKPSHVSLH
jgi:hypothetical protein